MSCRVPGARGSLQRVSVALTSLVVATGLLRPGLTSRAKRPASWATGLCGRGRGHGAHRFGGQALSGDGPIATLDFVDRAPGDAAQLLTLDADHGVGETF